MNRHYSFLLVLPLILTFSIVVLLFENKEAKSPKNQQTVNAVIGDESFLHEFGEHPTERVPDGLRIKTHLQYVEGILRNRSVDHLSNQQKRNRKKNLEYLREYVQAERYPRNDGPIVERRPVFISDNGNICAVGYLVEQSLGHKVAEEINLSYKYHFITEIDDPIFLKWAESSGFTVRELAMIQPMYGPTIREETKRNENQIDLSYGIGSSVLTGANVLYHSNSPGNPWLFNDASSSHWFGLAVGSASILIGVLNFDNENTFTEPVNSTNNICAGCFGVPLRKVTVTNHARKAVSIVNAGVGLFTVLRAGYHLINRTGEKSASPTTSLRVTQLESPLQQSTDVVPALQLNVRF